MNCCKDCQYWEKDHSCHILALRGHRLIQWLDVFCAKVYTDPDFGCIHCEEKPEWIDINDAIPQIGQYIAVHHDNLETFGTVFSIKQITSKDAFYVSVYFKCCSSWVPVYKWRKVESPYIHKKNKNVKISVFYGGIEVNGKKFYFAKDENFNCVVDPLALAEWLKLVM